MRTPWYFAAAFALALIAFDAQLYLDSRIDVGVTRASAQEVPGFAVSVTGLSRAPESAWQLQNPETDPETASAPQAAATTKTEAVLPPNEVPVRLIIPSIELDTIIDPMGLNTKGEMDVPDGSSKNVGWYRAGPRPGQIGSAVLDAHVFAAFENLKYVKVGEEIFVVTESGAKLRFVVQESTVYTLGDLSPAVLFGRKDARRLNLITCAGSPVGDTYSHRLVVYTTFAGVI